MADPASIAFQHALLAVLRELVDGATDVGFVLNPHDPGLLRSLDNLSAASASAVAAGGSSIAAHAEHIRYGLSLLNRWRQGENAFSDADYSASWSRVTVSDHEWAALRAELRAEAQNWSDAIRSAGDLSGSDWTALIGSVAHLAYHLGAIRQIDRSTRGPQARD